MQRLSMSMALCVSLRIVLVIASAALMLNVEPMRMALMMTSPISSAMWSVVACSSLGWVFLPKYLRQAWDSSPVSSHSLDIWASFICCCRPFSGYLLSHRVIKSFAKET
jgi:hypothetical protein